MPDLNGVPAFQRLFDMIREYKARHLSIVTQDDWLINPFNFPCQLPPIVT